jgi:hypothetical protein
MTTFQLAWVQLPVLPSSSGAKPPASDPDCVLKEMLRQDPAFLSRSTTRS